MDSMLVIVLVRNREFRTKERQNKKIVIVHGLENIWIILGISIYFRHLELIKKKKQ